MPRQRHRLLALVLAAATAFSLAAAAPVATATPVTECAPDPAAPKQQLRAEWIASAERLKKKDVAELFDDAQRLARRQPAIFVGGAFALGLVGARFLKSSSSSDEYDYQSRDMHRSYGSTSRAYDGGSTRRTSGSTGSLTGGRSTSDLGATGSNRSTYGGGSGRPTSTSSPGASGTTGSSVGAKGRGDNERS